MIIVYTLRHKIAYICQSPICKTKTVKVT